ncbi:Lymphocyte antigen 6 complex locus protein G6f [Dissostichus eleginoides]|uniref:Lymphocyte antigen 6 complex locus protein G6f n=1 Tax=Dissostichus eleginoides TaxID=100907 RepID=A0AAD9BW73_DISEL|nr:Lymphocyte antigen 6 complex locus protein G6f [Dissostichus eleginoides]
MDEFKRIKMSLFLVLLLQSTAAANRQPSHFFTVRVGEEVSLPCSGVRDDQDGCNGTDWLVTNSGCTTVKLVELGQIVEEARAESDRLRITENCSLVIKNVTEEDVGRYFWRQIRSGQDEDTLVHLSVVTMTEHQNNDEVTLRCSVKASVRTPSSGLLRLIVVSVGLATLIMIVVAVNIWTRIKEKKTQMEEISVRYDVDDGTVN